MPERPFLLERTPHLAFVDLDDAVWTVFDCRPSGDELVIVTVGSPTASVRVFQGIAGERRLYTFAAGEARGVEPATLSRQCGESGPLDGAGRR